MRLELPVRLEHPLYLCIIFISISGYNFLDTLRFGFWKYIIGLIIVMVAMWLLQKSKLTEKEVPIWAGAFIIIVGFFGGIILNLLIANGV